MSAIFILSVLMACQLQASTLPAFVVANYSQSNRNLTLSDTELPAKTHRSSYGQIRFHFAELSFLTNHVCNTSSPFFDQDTSKCRVVSTLCLFGHHHHVTSWNASYEHVLNLCMNGAAPGNDVQTVQRDFFVNETRTFSDLRNETWHSVLPFLRGLPKQGYVQLLFVIGNGTREDEDVIENGLSPVEESLVLTLKMPAQVSWGSWTRYASHDEKETLVADGNNFLAVSVLWRVSCSLGYFPEGQCAVHTGCSPSNPCTRSCSASGEAKCESGCTPHGTGKWRGLCESTADNSGLSTTEKIAVVIIGIAAFALTFVIVLAIAFAYSRRVAKQRRSRSLGAVRYNRCRRHADSDNAINRQSQQDDERQLVSPPLSTESC